MLTYWTQHNELNIQMESSTENQLCFALMPTDIKGVISKYLPVDTISIIAMCDLQFLNHILRNRRTYVDQFTVMNINYDVQTWKLFGKLHREEGLPARIEIVCCNIAIGMSAMHQTTTGCAGVRIGLKKKLDKRKQQELSKNVIDYKQRITTGEYSKFLGRISTNDIPVLIGSNDNNIIGYNATPLITTGSYGVAIGRTSAFTPEEFASREVILSYYLNNILIS